MGAAPALFAALIGSALQSCAPAGAEARPLCEVAARRASYAGRTLVLEGYLLASDHGSLVTDPRCGNGVGLGWRDEGGRFAALTRLVEQSLRMDETLMVRIRVTGVMRRETHGMMGGEPSWSLHLTGAEILDVRRFPAAEGERYLRWLAGPSAAQFRPAPGNR